MTDHVFATHGLWYARIGHNIVGSWRGRGEALAGLATEQRCARRRLPCGCCHDHIIGCVCAEHADHAAGIYQRTCQHHAFEAHEERGLERAVMEGRGR
jgi:hypothetical protein